jgi:hypothetical protein
MATQSSGSSAIGTASAAFNPSGKSFKQRLQALIDDAKATHGVTVGLQSNTRTVAWQQKHHVAHMLVYNTYKKRSDWKHISDASVEWDSVDWKEFLRTAKNKVPEKDGKKWKSGFEPEEKATIKQCKSLLKSGGIGNEGKAQVAAGLKPCGEPCNCSAGRSKHIDGNAADLKTSVLPVLTGALKKANAGSLDEYLAKFGLHRPPQIKNEPWHIESLD